jgi:hypothetical protein
MREGRLQPRRGVVRENYRRDITSCGEIALKPVLSLRAAEYVHPREVLQDTALNLAEKRAVLCAWASDACAVDSRPGFRWLPGTPGPILVDHLLTALKTLDQLSDLSRWEEGCAGRPISHIPQSGRCREKLWA